MLCTLSRSICPISRISFIRASSSASKPARVKPSRTPLQRLWMHSKYFVKVAFTGATPEAFIDQEDVLLRYVQDKIDIDEWCLVYDNQPAAVFHKCSAIGTPVGLFSASLYFIDVWKTDGQPAIGMFKKMYADVLDVGNFIYVPMVCIALTLCIIFRMQSMQMFRIYQNRIDPKRLRILCARGPMFRRWIDINRSEIVGTRQLYDASSYLRVAWYGHIRINGRAMYVDENCFRQNNMHSFVLGGSNRVPENLKTLDLAVESSMSRRKV